MPSKGAAGDGRRGSRSAGRRGASTGTPVTTTRTTRPSSSYSPQNYQGTASSLPASPSSAGNISFASGVSTPVRSLRGSSQSSSLSSPLYPMHASPSRSLRLQPGNRRRSSAGTVATTATATGATATTSSPRGARTDLSTASSPRRGGAAAKVGGGSADGGTSSRLRGRGATAASKADPVDVPHQGESNCGGGGGSSSSSSFVDNGKGASPGVSSQAPVEHQPPYTSTQVSADDNPRAEDTAGEASPTEAGEGSPKGFRPYKAPSSSSSSVASSPAAASATLAMTLPPSVPCDSGAAGNSAGATTLADSSGTVILLSSRTKLKQQPMFRVARALEDLLHVRLDAAIDDSIRDLRVQEQSLARIEDELKKTKAVIQQDVWAELKHQFPEVASSLTAKPYIDGSSLSPLGLQAVVNERNMLRRQLRHAAAQIADTEATWKMEMKRVPHPGFVDYTQMYLTEVRKLYQDIQEEFSDLHDELLQAQGLLDQANAEKRQLLHKHQVQVTELEHTIALQATNIAGLQQANATLRTELGLLNTEKDQMELRLKAAAETSRQQAEQRRILELAQQQARIVEEKNAEKAAALKELEDRLEALRAGESDELRAHYEERLVQLRDSLNARHTEELAQAVEKALQKQEKRLREEARLAREAAVDAAIEHFRRNNIATLEEMRRRLDEQHSNDKRTLQSKAEWQRDEIAHLRASERSLLLSGNETLPENETEAWRLRQSQGLTSTSQSRAGVTTSVERRGGRPRTSARSRPMSADSSLGRTSRVSTTKSGVWLPTAKSSAR
eukprot:m.349792 g.349792  ORF g.349792 m.349792 type:complete len:788 (-) comp19884_c5_seq25:2011-4374(-)